MEVVVGIGVVVVAELKVEVWALVLHASHKTNTMLSPSS